MSSDIPELIAVAISCLMLLGIHLIRQYFLSINSAETKRKQLEESLIAGEARYRSYVDTTGQIGWVTDAEGQVVEDVPSFRKFTGQTYEEIKGSGWAKALHPDDVEHALQVWNKAVAEKSSYETEYRMRRHDGVYRDFLARGFPVFREDGSIREWVGTCIDITERKRTEQELRSVTQRLKLATLSADLGVWDWDTINNTMVWDDRMLELYGRTPETFPGGIEAWQNGLHPEDRDKTIEECQAALRGEKEWNTDFRVLHPNGTVKHIKAYGMVVRDSEGTPIRMLGINYDITERKKAEEALRKAYTEVEMRVQERTAALNAANAALTAEITERRQIEDSLRRSEKNLKDITSSLAEGIYVADENRHVTFMNEAAANILGWALGELSEKNIHEVIHFQRGDGTPLPLEACRIHDVLNSGGQYYSNDEFFTRKNGTIFPASVLSSAILEDGKIVGIVTAFRDITERKRLEQEAIKAQKLESIGILAGGIAHDFNNLMQAIVMGIGVAKMYVRQDDKAYEILSDAEDVCATAKELSNRLLTFSKGGEPLKRLTSMAVLLRESASLALSGSNIVCEFCFPDDLYPAEVDEGQMRQVIHNLLINAKDAMPDKGLVAISAENVTLQEDNSLSLRAGRYLKISVRDQGKGIPQKYLSRIFDPYFSTKGMGSRKGIGLGLTICHSVINKHGGTITVESGEGVGTTFHLYLPAAEGQSIKQKGGEEQETTGVFRGSGRILLMDDEKDVRESVQRVLEAIGYETVTTANGEVAIEAYSKAQEANKPFHAVILDLTVKGGMGGEDAVKELLKIDSGVKAIVSSGYKENPILKDFKNYGFVAALEKPYNIQEIQELLGTLLK